MNAERNTTDAASRHTSGLLGTKDVWLDALVRAVIVSRTTPLPARLFLACLFVLLALAIRVLVLPDLSGRPSYVPFHVAVVFAAIFTGAAGCISAALLSVLLTHTLFFPLAGASGFAIFITFLSTAVILSALIEAISATATRWLVAEKVRTRELHLRLFIEQAPVAIAMFDRNMKYLAASRRWLADYQIAGPDIVGRQHYEIFPDLREHMRDVHRRALQGETLSSEKDKIVLKSGAVRWERWEVLPWLMDDGTIGGITIFTDDITGRVQAEDQLLQNKAQLNRAQSVAKLGNWRMVFATGALQGSAQTFALVGQPQDAKLSFQLLLDMVHPEDRDYISSIRKSASRGEAYGVEYRYIINGKMGWMREQSEPEFDETGKLVGAFGVIQDITDRKAVDEELRSSEERLRLALDAACMAVWHLDLNTGVNSWNDQCYRLLGYEPGEIEANANSWMSHVHPDERNTIAARFKASIEQGTEISNEHRIIDRNGIQKWVAVRGRCTCDPAGRPIRSFGVITDITERKQAEERDRLLTLEVNHRAKNLLAVVQAVALQTARQHSGPALVEYFNQRIKSLAASHDLLVNSKWQAVSLADLVTAQLAHFDGLIGSRIHYDGPYAGLTPEAAQAIGLALHELVTNASKYGALKTAEGTIAITWQIEQSPDGDRFKLCWCEAGGPPAAQPERYGFGHSVLVSMAEYALAAHVSLTFPPEGLKWHLDAPAEIVLRPASRQQ